MALNFRKIHRKSAPLLFFPLFLSALTGVAYRLGRSWLGLSNDAGGFLMTLHQGAFLGNGLAPFYVLSMGIGLIGMVVTGVMMIRRKRSAKSSVPTDDRGWHRVLAIAAFIPLTLSALTGIAYRLGQSWLDISPGVAGALMRLHQGAYLGDFLRNIYVLFLGLGLIALVITGIKMTPLLRRPRTQPPSQS